MSAEQNQFNPNLPENAEAVPDIPKAGAGVLADPNGKYRWVAERPLLKSFFLLLEVWRVLGIAAAVVAVIMIVFGLAGGSSFLESLKSVGVAALVLCILLVLSVPAYLIVTKANNGKYTVLFEMDEKGVDHIQIKTAKAQALDLLTAFVGGAANNPTTTAAGLLSATGGSLYSEFAKVKKVKAVPDKNMIKLNGTLKRNQVYTEPRDFDFVLDHIVKHCPNAKIS